MSEEEDDIILSELDDEELVQQMFDDLYDGLREEIEEGVNILLERDWEPYDILTKALVGGMTIVGQDFRDGILFVPEVLLSANAMKGGMAILKPLLAETGARRTAPWVRGRGAQPAAWRRRGRPGAAAVGAAPLRGVRSPSGSLARKPAAPASRGNRRHAVAAALGDTGPARGRRTRAPVLVALLGASESPISRARPCT